jgi:hypothetical protein
MFGRGFNSCNFLSHRFFVGQRQANESVEEKELFPYSFDGHDDDVCDKVGQAVGNL